MTLKITLTVDQDHGAELVGLLAKAYGRGELGIAELLIERPNERVATLRPVPAKTIAKLTGHSTYPAQATSAPKTRRRPAGERLRGRGVAVALQLVAKGQPYANRELKEQYAKHGLAGDGAGATLSKLCKHGYIRRIVEGHYALTSKGEARLRDINDKKVEHDDSPHN